MNITVETTVNAPLEQVWSAWTTPVDIMNWNVASDGWHCPAAELDFTVGGDFSYRMESTDGSMGFDFAGTFTIIELHRKIAFILGDGRNVSISFSETGNGTHIVETFEADDKSAEQQKQGWQNILNKFKEHVENR